ncbi:hypothetical protein IF2G_00611 [Cordyceps javanica]|nr:hypothetical protein IF2G_00611 [Cordyceps javanica]
MIQDSDASKRRASVCSIAVVTQGAALVAKHTRPTGPASPANRHNGLRLFGPTVLSRHLLVSIHSVPARARIAGSFAPTSFRGEARRTLHEAVLRFCCPLATVRKGPTNIVARHHQSIHQLGSQPTARSPALLPVP